MGLTKEIYTWIENEIEAFKKRTMCVKLNEINKKPLLKKVRVK